MIFSLLFVCFGNERGFKWLLELSFPNKGLPFPLTVGHFIRTWEGEDLENEVGREEETDPGVGPLILDLD